MDEETYDKRKGTVREWIREQRAKDPDWKPPQMPGAQMANSEDQGPALHGGGRRAHCRRVAVRGPARRAARLRQVLWGAGGQGGRLGRRRARRPAGQERRVCRYGAVLHVRREPRHLREADERPMWNFTNELDDSDDDEMRRALFNRSFPVLLGRSLRSKQRVCRRPSSAARAGPR